MRPQLNPLILGVGAPWSLPGSSLDIQFTTGRAAVNRQKASISSLLTTTRASTGYAQTSTGSLTLFPANTPRITDLGLLVEQAATNLCLQSQTLDNAAWGTQNATVSANVATAPDGTLTADGNVPNNGSNNNSVSQSSLPVTSAVTYTLSFYIKYVATLGLPWIELTTAGDATKRTWFNTQTGTIGTTGHTSATASSLGNSWYRFTVTFTAASTTSDQIFASSRPANGNSGPVTGDGVSPAFYIWGAQFEASAFATSYIPTTTVSVTRAADIINLAGVGLTAAINSKSALITTNFMSGSSTPRAVDFNGVQQLRWSSTTVVNTDNGVNTGAQATIGGAGTYAGLVKYAAGFDANGYTAKANGGTQVSDTTHAWGSMSGPVTIGNGPNGDRTHPINGYMLRLTFGPIKGQFDELTI